MQVRLGRGNSGYLDQVSLSPEFVEALRLVVGGNNVLAEGLASYGTDWTGRFIGSPSLVVRPGSTSEVSQVLHLCSQHNVAVVPQGGNTGLVGGTLADDGQIILSTSRINWIGSIDAVSQQISVGAGATVEQVQESAKQFGLR